VDNHHTPGKIKSSTGDQARLPVEWQSLRDWLSLVEKQGSLKHIGASVDPNEELGAITFLAARQPNSPALLFENLLGDKSSARILSNMLGASWPRNAPRPLIIPNG
jgi:3-octaprenyl-4-hydroxybenzoate carboxy-lyase